ncbi:selenocysteine-specific elongation factor [Halanaerobium saccharolyticum]|uniref:Selenocysteine-specific elongation factor n=1 Tax=Halanaerobium saccharolyticum TaxID=43595 RepID=A0A4R6LKY0_9FIRM|nr:selenocysteine-specific translation elongation factor [Halanaerobium saccharolyticum]TDO85453.1 selenocysteine-specific elongation factor [Halanaerobium saccharolyticum]
MKKNLIIGTAGHIDHGKSTLIKALTGDETDRLDQEKTRGISIENGFSQLENEKTRAENLKLGIVDVPGHKKFVNKMLSAAAGVDLALIVVAADEGVMPQTKEHLAILDLLGVKKAIIVLTKIDLVDREWLQLIELDLRDHLKNSFAETAEIVRVSSTKEAGIIELKDLIVKTALKMDQQQRSEITYFPVDRVFSLKGLGTVVTGTLFSGQLKSGDELSLYPEKKRLKIKSLESHGCEKQQINAGSRVGINISGINKSEIKRGDIIAESNSLLKSKFFEGELRLLDDLNFTVKNGDQIHFHTAALKTRGRIYLYNKKEAFPGEKVYIKLILEKAAALVFKQKFVLRRISPLNTIGGGEILELDPPPSRKVDNSKTVKKLKELNKASIRRAVELFIEKRQNEPAKIELLKKKSALKSKSLKEILNKLTAEEKILELAPEKSYIHQSKLKDIENSILKIVSDYHQEYSLKPGIKKEELRSRLDFKLKKNELNSLLQILYKKELLKEKNNLIAHSSFQIKLSPEIKEIKDKVIKKYKKHLFSPPTRTEMFNYYQLEEELFDYLENEGVLIRLSAELYFHISVLNELNEMFKEYFRENDCIDLAEFRDLIDSSRRYALPLLEKTDQIKITKRVEDYRYPGENLEL